MSPRSIAHDESLIGQPGSRARIDTPALMLDLEVLEQTPDGARRFDNALFVHTSVVSANHPGFVTTDAGSKSFAMDGPTRGCSG